MDKTVLIMLITSGLFTALGIYLIIKAYKSGQKMKPHMKDQTYVKKIHGVNMTYHGKGYEGKNAGKDRMNGCMIFIGVMLTLIAGFVFFISIKMWIAYI